MKYQYNTKPALKTKFPTGATIMTRRKVVGWEGSDCVSNCPSPG